MVNGPPRAERTAILLPLATTIIGTVTFDTRIMRERDNLAAYVSLRTFAPTALDAASDALDAAGLSSHAETLRYHAVALCTAEDNDPIVFVSAHTAAKVAWYATGYESMRAATANDEATRAAMNTARSAAWHAWHSARAAKDAIGDAAASAANAATASTQTVIAIRTALIELIRDMCAVA